MIPKAGIDNFGNIREYYQQLTSDDPVVREAPTVVVLTASDVVGLARKEETVLQSKDFDVKGIADTNSEYPDTMIVDTTNRQKPASRQILQQLFSGATVTSTTAPAEVIEAQGYSADFVVILGKNWDAAQH